jgi:hypothetical protein
VTAPLANLPRYGGEITACFGKVAYRTVAEARRALWRMTRRPNWRRSNPNATLTPYRCPFCGQARLGNSRR